MFQQDTEAVRALLNRSTVSLTSELSDADDEGSYSSDDVYTKS